MVTSQSHTASYGISQAISTVQTNWAKAREIPLMMPQRPSQRGRAWKVSMSQPQAKAKPPIGSQMLASPRWATSYV